ncbi:hypothetical protein Tco_1344007 [Tanacetum coccineum]
MPSGYLRHHVNQYHVEGKKFAAAIGMGTIMGQRDNYWAVKEVGGYIGNCDGDTCLQSGTIHSVSPINIVALNENVVNIIQSEAGGRNTGGDEGGSFQTHDLPRRPTSLLRVVTPLLD